MFKEAEKMVDNILDEQVLGFKEMEELTDSMLDEIKGPGGHTPDGSGPPPHGKGQGQGKGKTPCKEDEDLSENAYKEFFKAELSKAGKPITKMSPDEKKAFFGKVSKKWKAKKS